MPTINLRKVMTMAASKEFSATVRFSLCMLSSARFSSEVDTSPIVSSFACCIPVTIGVACISLKIHYARMLPPDTSAWRKDPIIMTCRLIICIWTVSAAVPQTPGKAPQKPAEPAASQSKPAAPPTLQKREEKAPEITPDQPVITIRGLCPAATSPATKSAVPSTKECTTAVTKAQFDNLVKSFNTSNQPLPP